MPNLFMPLLYSSQPCESLFRQIRSFTCTYSTVVNCSVKEILSRLHKIQLQNDMSSSISDFIYSKANGATSIQVPVILPTKQQIINEIYTCKKLAIEDSIRITLLSKKKISDNIFHCQIEPPKTNKLRKTTSEPTPIIGSVNLQLRSLCLRDYSKQKNLPLEEDSPYISVPFGDGKSKIVRKTSLCWLFRADHMKMNSDRLQRVQTRSTKKKPNKFSVGI